MYITVKELFSLKLYPHDQLKGKEEKKQQQFLQCDEIWDNY